MPCGAAVPANCLLCPADMLSFASGITSCPLPAILLLALRGPYHCSRIASVRHFRNLPWAAGGILLGASIGTSFAGNSLCSFVHGKS